MKASPIALAALASVAVPGLAPKAAGPSADDPGIDAALLLDAEDRRWKVRAPRGAKAQKRLENERQVLAAFDATVRPLLPFEVPTVAGTLQNDDRCVLVYAPMKGYSLTLAQLAEHRHITAQQIAQAISGIHALPPRLLTDAHRPAFTASDLRSKALRDLDRAEATGQVPASLLHRWEIALDDRSLWQFTPCVVQGDLGERNFLFHGDRLSTVTNWAHVHQGDPATDFSWLVSSESSEFVSAVQNCYMELRQEACDPHIFRRAALRAELALAQWLVRGLTLDNPQLIAEANHMLASLAKDIGRGVAPLTETTPPVPQHQLHKATAASEPQNIPPGPPDDISAGSTAPVDNAPAKTSTTLAAALSTQARPTNAASVAKAVSAEAQTAGVQLPTQACDVPARISELAGSEGFNSPLSPCAAEPTGRSAHAEPSERTVSSEHAGVAESIVSAQTAASGEHTVLSDRSAQPDSIRVLKSGPVQPT